VTLLGDAAHLTALVTDGEGANLALHDGVELGKTIAAHPDDIETALTEHEQAMFVRSATANNEAHDLYDMLGDGTPHTLIDTFTGS
jgi:2-polyprenyl-6-methoxyphenol hydroxylase-like FAD-dependent oxidoreductase